MARKELWFAGMTRDAIHKAIEARKALLLQMVRSGQPRPSRYSDDSDENSLARTLEAACDENGQSYDFSFDVAVRSVPSDWFDADRYERGDKAREAVFKLARSGGSRPQAKAGDPFATAMCSQVHWHRDELFKIRPDWYDPDMADRVIQIKEEILAYASSGGKRPHRKSAKNEEEQRFAEAIERFTSPSQHAYDAEFTTKLKAIRPDWFRDTKLELAQQRDEEDKKIFLEMAANGAKRPSIKEHPKLARRLQKLLNKDKEFHQQITAANSTWVGNSRDMKAVWEDLPKWPDKEFTYEGETLSIREWAAKLGCKKNTLYQYLLNHTIEEAVKLQTRKRRLTCDGETMTLTKWAKKLGISPSSLVGRLQSYPMEIALSPKNWENRNK